MPVDALLADKALVGKLAKPTLADLAEVRARIALNAGDLPEAQRWIDRALAATGGLTLSANQLQLAIRGDAAIVAQLRRDPDEARRYLTYTGAGHLKSVGWISAFSGDLPVCGTAGDVRPDDSAVVQVTIATDGHVVSATPVYASRPGDVGMAFARAAQDWRWDQQSVAKVEPFWRASLRLEMRCDTRPDPQALGKPIGVAARDWLNARGVDLPDRPAFTARTDPALGRDGLSAVPALLAVAGRRSAGPALPARLYRILDAGGAPASLQAVAVKAVADNDAEGAGTIREAARRRAAALAVAVPAFAARYPATAELAWLRLEWAIALERAGDFATALPLLRQVLATPAAALDRDDPIREVATLHVALGRGQAGDADGAQADLKAAGLNAAQCSLVDTRPVPTNLSIVSSQFPAEAQRWHFEGFARIAYDIGADGHVADVRTVLAYPPFVFGPGTEKAARGFRYVAPTLDGKVVGCQGERQTVSYRLP